MYNFDTHTSFLADLEESLRDSRQYPIQMPMPSMQVISFLVALIIAGSAIGIGVA